MRRLLPYVALLALATPAFADNREDARREFALAQAADKAKDYQTAIEHYLRAYELVPHHFALYNIGTAYERLGQLREAARWFQRYLDEAPQSLRKERGDVEKILLELKLRPAKLTVTSKPAGARLEIDGQPAGITPFTRQIRGGGHRVRVELEGAREERDVVLEYAEPYTVDISLPVTPTNKAQPQTDQPQTAVRPTQQTQTSGVLVVTGTQGALVAIDEQVVGVVPGKFHAEPGQHKLTVTKYGFAPDERSVQVTTGAATPVEVQLVAGSAPPPAFANGVFGYYVGAAGGADLRGEGAMIMGELGYRVFVLDIGVRVGKATGRTAVDILFRYHLLRKKFTPFVQAGYAIAGGSSGDTMSTSTTSTGYLVGGGIRYDLLRSGSSAISLLAESGLRLIASTSSTDDKVVFIPLLASVQFTFAANQRR